MTCACCLHVDSPGRPVMALGLTDGALVLCRKCWLDFCELAGKALGGEDNQATSGAH